MRVFDSRKTLAFGVLLLASTLAVHAVVPKGTAAVKDIEIARSGDALGVSESSEALEAKIMTTGPAKFTYFELTKPRRLVVDFRDLQNGVGFKEKLVSYAGVERIRAGLFQSKDRNAVRIVFELKDEAHYKIIDDKTEVVRVVFGEPAAVIVPAPAAPLPEVPVRLAEEAKSPASFVMAPSVAPAPLPAPQLVSVQPRINLQSLNLTAQDVSAPRLASGLMLASALPAGVAVMPQVVVSAPTAPGTSLSAAQSSQFSGEIVSFDVRDLELKDFFRLISEASGLNIVLDPNVSGTLPMLRLTDVPWDQALDIVLKQNQLGGVLQGNVLRIATNGTLGTEESTRKAQLDAKEATTELVTRTYILSYTKADLVASTLTKSLSKRGEIVHDVRKNALIVTDAPAQFSKFDQMVKFLDTPAQQVEIEARLLSANKSFSRDLGTQIGMLVGNKNIATGGAGATNPISVAGKGGLPLVTNLPAAATSGLAFLLQPGSDIFLDGVLTMAEANGKAKLLSSPRIMTQNNQAATVSQGTQIPVQSSVNNTVTTQFINFSLNLTVTPQITEAGTILLTVLVENSVPDFARSVNGIPSVATQKAQTQVLIPDGGTAVIGGIYVDTDSLNVRQVPGLGSIPVIGHLFKETQTIKSTSELIFFVTPKVKAMDQIMVNVPDIKDGTQK